MSLTTLALLLCPRAAHAIETCNGIDDDGDGAIDEGPVLVSVDSDGDGYGSDSDAVLELDCGSLSGVFSSDVLDCDDTDIATGPGTVELCDAIDNDCDGLFDEGACPGEVETEDDSAWLVVFDPGDWDSAVAGCDAIGWHLATVSGSQQQEGIFTSIDPYSDEFWIGYQDRDVEGSWAWIDGSGGGYTHWRAGEPNGLADSLDDCATMEPSGLWSDGLCTEVWPYVCEHLCTERWWYKDSDGDGLGDALVDNDECEQLAGFVANALDCDDDDPALPAVFYLDDDGDGFGTVPFIDCVGTGGTLSPGDCDDTSFDIHPGAGDLPGNGVDEDCSGGDEPLPEPVDTGTTSTDSTDTTTDTSGSTTDTSGSTTDTTDSSGSTTTDTTEPPVTQTTDTGLPSPEDSDGDGIPDAIDPDPFDAGGLVASSPKPSSGCACDVQGPRAYSALLLAGLFARRIRS